MILWEIENNNIVEYDVNNQRIETLSVLILVSVVKSKYRENDDEAILILSVHFDGIFSLHDLRFVTVFTDTLSLHTHTKHSEKNFKRES